ncbi:vacuolar iron transporter Ccc1 [Echria macrotheca]|uniref:Vacuolar iron transporter Ccc1 n=1 Tax=Echria macrotheca TaxID=438768 RepID=A0AAJ0BMF5_9PEZI|nr:vacuolar iron transporter Ccc1 [Echria macrotheca]
MSTSYGTISTTPSGTPPSGSHNENEETSSPNKPPLSRRNSDLSSATMLPEDLESQSSAPSSPPNKSFQITARIISDATIGLSDGLTVPFALTAGLSALGNARVVIFGGLAELMAGAISMGLGGYLGAMSELASYNETLSTTTHLAKTDPRATAAQIRSTLEEFDIPKSTLDDLTRHLCVSDKRVDFLMRFGHCAERPADSRALVSAVTIAVAYFLGGLVPLVPYFFVDDLIVALWVSVGVMAVALFAFGYAKTGMVVGWEGRERVGRCVYGGLQMVVVGGLAAGAAMGLVKVFDGFVGGD